MLRSSCHCSPVWHFRIWQTRVSPGLSGLVPPIAPQATAPDGEISSLRPRKPRLPVAWPASLILSMTRLSVSQTSRCPANCHSNLNLCLSVQLQTSPMLPRYGSILCPTLAQLLPEPAETSATCRLPHQPAAVSTPCLHNWQPLRSSHVEQRIAIY